MSSLSLRIFTVVIVATAVTSGPESAVDAASSRPTSAKPPKTQSSTIVSTTATTVTSWASGVYPGATIDAAGATTFANFRGRPVDVAVMFVPRSTWTDISSTSWEYTLYSGFTGRLAVGVPLLPDSATQADLASVASGAHDATFRAVAARLVSLGRSNADIRLGWEFNGDWQRWSAYDSTTFRAAFHHVALIFRAASSKFTIDWNGNAGYSQCGNEPFATSYPGDDVVDVVGLDAYDTAWTGITDDATFTAWLGSDHGLTAWLNFAKKHGKKFAVPEWGSVRYGGGDDTAYIKGMYNFFVANASFMAYEAYFNEPATPVQNNLDGATLLPRSSALYAQQW